MMGIGQSSGAYVFRPDFDGRKSISDSPNVTTISGPLVNEIIVTLADWAVYTTREYIDNDITEVTWQVGPLVDGKEVVMVYNSDVLNNDFYTDANGRQMMKRVVNEFTAEREAANYYPVTNRIEKREDSGSNVVSVITDRSQGGSSLKAGELELMVHRRCLYDDGYGVGESLMEEAYGTGLVARGHHFLMTQTTAAARLLQQEKVLTPQLSLISTSLSSEEWLSTNFQPYSGLSVELPASIQLLTMSKWKGDNKILLRFQHIFDKVS